VMLDLGAGIGRQHAHDVVYDAAQAVNSLPTVTPFSRPIVTPLGGQEWAYPRSA